MITDEKNINIIFAGVRNVLIASLDNIKETWRRRSTFLLERTLNIYIDLPWGLIIWLKNIKIIFAGVRNILLASLSDLMETWRRRSTSWLGRTVKIYKDLPWGLIIWFLMRKNPNHLCRSQERPLSFLGWYKGAKRTLMTSQWISLIIYSQNISC